MDSPIDYGKQISHVVTGLDGQIALAHYTCREMQAVSKTVAAHRYCVFTSYSDPISPLYEGAQWPPNPPFTLTWPVRMRPQLWFKNVTDVGHAPYPVIRYQRHNTSVASVKTDRLQPGMSRSQRCR